MILIFPAIVGTTTPDTNTTRITTSSNTKTAATNITLNNHNTNTNTNNEQMGFRGVWRLFVEVSWLFRGPFFVCFSWSWVSSSRLPFVGISYRYDTAIPWVFLFLFVVFVFFL